MDSRGYGTLVVHYANRLNNSQIGQTDHGDDEMNFFKKRSRFGKWLDDNKITQTEISDKSRVNRNTIGQLANDDNARPSWQAEKRIVKAAREFDKDVSIDDWGW